MESASAWPHAPQKALDGDRLMRKVSWRILPFLLVCYIVNYIDRTNVSLAALTMNADLGISPVQFGWVVGWFFFGYVLCEIPSNLLLQRFGARIWISRIMITWGLICMASAGVQTTGQLYVARFLLGLAEGGFTAGIFLHLAGWFPERWRTRALATFLLGVPVSAVIGAPLGGAILSLDGIAGIKGWQWLFLLEGAPAVFLGVACLFVLTDVPVKAAWLSQGEREWIDAQLRRERLAIGQAQSPALRAVLTDARVLLLALVNFSALVALYGVAFWIPQIVKVFGLSHLAVGFATAAPYLCGALGMILWSKQSDQRVDRARQAALPCILGAIGLLAGSVLSAPLPVIAALTISIVGIYAFLATFWALPPTFLTGRAAAIGIAFIVSTGNIAGFVGPYLVGWIRQATASFAGALFALSLFLLLAAAVLFLFRRRTTA